MKKVVLILCALALAACSSPNKPPPDYDKDGKLTIEGGYKADWRPEVGGLSVSTNAWMPDIMFHSVGVDPDCDLPAAAVSGPANDAQYASVWRALNTDTPVSRALHRYVYGEEPQ